MRTSRWRILQPLVLLVLLWTAAPAQVQASGPFSAHLPAPSERAHSFWVGFPGVFYEGSIPRIGRFSAGVRVGLLYRPFMLSVGANLRLAHEFDERTAIALQLVPGVALGNFGGYRSIYPAIAPQGQLFSVAPHLETALLVSRRLGGSRNAQLLAGLEVPVWFWVQRPPGTTALFSLEWMIAGAIGYETDINFAWRFFVRASAGAGFQSRAQTIQAGVYLRAFLGFQYRY